MNAVSIDFHRISRKEEDHEVLFILAIPVTLSRKVGNGFLEEDGKEVEGTTTVINKPVQNFIEKVKSLSVYLT